MRSALCDAPRRYQGNASEAMPDHERHGCSLFLGVRQELRRTLSRVARDDVQNLSRN
jgi:hypothetical protein